MTVKTSNFPTNGLVAWYPFNGNANDESGNGMNGNVTGATLTSNGVTDMLHNCLGKYMKFLSDK